jgi:hypothetical protein
MNAWFNTNRLAVEGVVLALLVVLGLYVHHRIYQSGVASVQREDAAALVQAKAAADIITAKLAHKAEDASHVHDQELSDLRTYRDHNPVHLRVCNNANSSLSRVPDSALPHSGDAGSIPAAGDVQPVPAGSSGESDIGPLLELLAGRADKLAAQLREYQKR